MSDKDEDVFRPMTDEELCKACGIKLPELWEMNEALAERLREKYGNGLFKKRSGTDGKL